MVIYRHKAKYSISEMCRFFEVSRSGYYGYAGRMDTSAKDLPLAKKISKGITEWQERENTAIPLLKEELAEIEKSLGNVMAAIE